ncbi:MAG: hypothetical protein A3F83_01320 [Candidatus Glassbacteria bacterium RIFCSPLOWO2_12_FULL_58_11]|uniref:Uncharacterized protein n=2 Tax=Candidatus Glassiibacteriota TaxID=1817805 RepID=A0A1F5YLK1_9BACT|nr:MAG: hypothetical protein A2Z86_00205 [Candidatus Glassbacteria bacterium GWA2_58_10]OGG00847.1 MAG: hypothetical protein A3F83_01320 [Candidatus Glassbacteria bacterium RIFCSPLOWO2_12_FULL_58_11]
MDDSLAKDQLNLWSKLNRLYGEGGQSPAKEGTADRGGEGDSGPDKPATSGPELVKDPPVEETEQALNAICEDCDKDCKQNSETFLLSRCPKSPVAAGSRAISQQRGLRSSMGFEKINDTCKLCRKSCKQHTKKLNLMLCLGFEPIESE